MKNVLVSLASFAIIATPNLAHGDLRTENFERQTTVATQKASDTSQVRNPGFNLKTISDHPGSAIRLTPQQKAEIEAFLDRTNARQLVCTGAILPNQTERMNTIVDARAQQACEHAKSLRPELKVSHQVKETVRSTHNGRVILLSK